MPTPGRGQRLYLLHLPFGVRHPNVTYRKELRRHIYIGATLPDEIAPYAAQPYSYEAWVEDNLNGNTRPGLSATSAPMTPRDTQIADATAIAEAAAAGWRGALVSSGVGTGKTITCILAAKVICKLRGGDTIVVTVDRPAAMSIPHWRASIAAVGDGGYRWIVVSSDGGLKNLMGSNGRPRVRPTVVINDEAHQFRRESQRTARMRRLNRLTEEPSGRTPFVLSVTATPGHSPAEYLFLSGLLAQVYREPASKWVDVGAQLAGRGFPLAKSYGTWGWDERAKASGTVRRNAIVAVRDLLLGTTPPVMVNRQPAWGPPVLEGLPVELEPEQRRLYLAEWGDFQREMHLARTGNDVARGIAAITRFRQKAAHVCVNHTIDRVKADVEAGFQVLVAVEHVTTAAQPIADGLEKEGIAVARLFGGRPDVEQERQRFQRGQAVVAVVNTTSSISLHAGEQLPDGTKATTTPRRGYFHQPRYSGIAAQQMMGRAHRDGQRCDWFLLFGENTVEDTAARRMVSRLSGIADSVDGDKNMLADIARLFGADWLPADKALGD